MMIKNWELKLGSMQTCAALPDRFLEAKSRGKLADEPLVNLELWLEFEFECDDLVMSSK